MSKGIFITIEGPDGSGKSTQMKYIEEYFNKKNLDVLYTREPGGTLIGEKIRSIILDIGHMEMDDRSEALLYAAARAQHVAEVIIPALNEGKIVICDRYVDSSIVYQGYGRKLGDDVRVINEFATQKLKPELTILFLLDPKIGRNRIINTQNPDRLEIEKIDFHERVYNAYLEIAKGDEERFRRIDASKDIESMKIQIIGEIESLLTRKGY